MLLLVRLKDKHILGKYADERIDLATDIGKGIVKNGGGPIGIFIKANGSKPRRMRTIKSKGFLRPKIEVV